MKCVDLGTEFCIAEDLFSCAPVPASGKCAEFGAAPGAGLATYHVAPALTVAPIPAPTEACIDHMKGADSAIPASMMAKYKEWDSDKDALPMDKFFCDTDLPGAEVKKAFEYFMKTLEICPMYCVPGSADTVKSADGTQDLPINHGTCLTNADAAEFGDEVRNLPIYKAQGTNDRFDAGNNLASKVCDRAEAFMEGWAKGEEDGETPPASLIQKEADLKEAEHAEGIASSEAKADKAKAKAQKKSQTGG